ncbi:MAG: DUF4065 domain-containing protein [Brevundimonas sp.]|nr:MAG: DUF4065 domain-containing protein [Brevundimonas sp.]
MAYDGRAIANFVLDVCQDVGRPVSNLALQKIVYFCHVWSLIELKTPLIKHSFEAWEFGPVLPYLYREFKPFDSSSITSRAKSIDPLSGASRIVNYEFDSTTRAFLEKVVSFYSQLTAGDLVKLSHAKGGPWDETWNHAGVVNPGMKIKEDSIVSFYSHAFVPFSLQ